MDSTLLLPPEILIPIFRLVEDNRPYDPFRGKIFSRPRILREALHEAALVCSRWFHVIHNDTRSFMAPVLLDFEEENCDLSSDLRRLMKKWSHCLAAPQSSNHPLVLSVQFEMGSLNPEYSDTFNEEAGTGLAHLVTPHTERLHALDLTGCGFSTYMEFFKSFLDGIPHTTFQNLHSLRLSGVDYTSRPLSFPRLRNLTLIASELSLDTYLPDVEVVTLIFQIHALRHIVNALLSCSSIQSLIVEGGAGGSCPGIPNGFIAPASLTKLSLQVDFEIIHGLLFPIHFPGLETLELTGYPIHPERAIKPYPHPLNTVHFPNLRSLSLTNCWPTSVVEFLSCNLPMLQHLQINMSGIWAYYHNPDRWKFGIAKAAAPKLASLDLTNVPFRFVALMLDRLDLEYLATLSVKHNHNKTLRRFSSNGFNALQLPELPSLTTMHLDIPSDLMANLLQSFPQELPRLTKLSFETGPLPPSAREPISLPALASLAVPPSYDSRELGLEDWIQFKTGPVVLLA